jgi:hypothetical protein
MNSATWYCRRIIFDLYCIYSTTRQEAERLATRVLIEGESPQFDHTAPDVGVRLFERPYCLSARPQSESPDRPLPTRPPRTDQFGVLRAGLQLLPAPAAQSDVTTDRRFGHF